MLFDSHLHIVDRKRLAYPWLTDAGALNRDSLYEDYAREAKRLGIADTLHMEVDVAETDIERETDYVKSLSREPGSLLRGKTKGRQGCQPGFASMPYPRRSSRLR